MQNY